MAFLGLNIDNTKKYTQTIHMPIRVTSCSLRTFKEGRTSLKVTVDEQTFVLGHLTANKHEQIAFECTFDAGEVVTFESDGPNELSLIGEVLADNEDMEEFDNYEYDVAESDLSESIDQESEAKITEIVEQHNNPDNSVSTVEKDVDVDMQEGENERSDVEEEMNEEEIEAIMAEVKKWKGSDNINEEDVAAYIHSLTEDGENEEMTEEQEMQELVAAVKESTGKETVTDKDIEEFLQNLSGSDKSESESEGSVKDAVVEFQQPGQKRKQQADAIPQKKQKVAEKEVTNSEKPNKSERVTKEGIVIKDMNTQNGYKAKNGDKVSVRYLGRLANGKTFDSNMKGKPFSFSLGKGDVIKGWDLGIIGMTEGSTRKLTIPPNLAYGKRGSSGIPGSSTLVFDIKMLKITSSKSKK
eukprot:NODE_262_length_12566_cov_0.133392.p2 type:complete len:411 gc:universal NODE_262_length_12566_cov_0.133392:1574-342(-)